MSFIEPEPNDQVVVHGPVQAKVEIAESRMSVAPPEHGVRVQVKSFVDEVSKAEIERMSDRAAGSLSRVALQAVEAADFDQQVAATDIGMQQ